MTFEVEKKVILDILKKSIHELIQTNELIDLVGIEDSNGTQNLCSSIEALFIHSQYKNQTNTFFNKIGRNKQSYDYDFWNFIREFIPQNLIKVLESSSLKLTPVGMCRTWLRYALNECTILSYLESVRSDTKRLQQFYSKESLLRDEDKMETFCGLLTSIQRIPFNLNTKSSLLNTWINSDALKIAGIEIIHSLRNETINRPNLTNYQATINSDNRSLSSSCEENEEILTKKLYNKVKKYSSSLPHKQNFDNSSFISINDQSMDECQTIDILYNDLISNESDTNYLQNDIYFSENELKINVLNKMDLKSNFLITSNQHFNLCPNSNPQYENLNDDNHSNIKILTNVFEYSNSPQFNIINSQNSLESNDLNNETYGELSSEHVDLSINSNKNIHPIDIDDESLKTDTEIFKTESISLHESYDEIWSKHAIVNEKSIEKVNVLDIEEESNENGGEKGQSELITSLETLGQSKVYSSLIASKLILSSTDFVCNLFMRRFNFPIFTVKESDESWEFIGDDLLVQKLEMKRLMDIFPGIDICSTSDGLNSVFGGLCSKCNKTFEIGKVLIDHYDGKLFCTLCESGTQSVIPRDVINNWDFDLKTVSETTKRFLSEIISHPNINLASHLSLFEMIPELARVRKLRQKLNLLWLQVTSCDIETSTKVRETMFPREYMLASVKENDLYSLEDLIILKNGILEKTLLFVINKIAIPHVKKCLMCRMKAMACDKCRDESRVIFIHEIDEYCECSTPLCKSVIHKTCKISPTNSFYCRRCVQYLLNHQPITLASYDTANCYD